MDEFLSDYQNPERKEVLPKPAHFTKFMKTEQTGSKTLSSSERLKKIAGLIKASGYNPARKTILQIHQLATKS